MSKLLLGLEKEDLFLAVFDHHTDMQPPALLPVLSCGSWIRDAAGAYQNIKGICVIGPPEASVRETEAMEHVWFVTQEELDDGSGAAKIKEIFASHAGTFPVYLSVDKDILSKEELDTNWDQGNVRVDELLSLAKDCLAGRKVLAVDLCGEPSANAPEAECSGGRCNSAIPYGKPPSRKAGQYRRGRLSAGSEFAERNNGEWRSIDGRDKKEAGGWRRYLICREEIPV